MRERRPIDTVRTYNCLLHLLNGDDDVYIIHYTTTRLIIKVVIDS